MARLLPPSLPLESLAAGSRIARVHWKGSVEPYFGPTPPDPPSHRFHDPLGVFRVCFLGESDTAGFVETFLRKPPTRIITLDELSQRRLARVGVRRELRLVSLYGKDLGRLGCTAEVTSSKPPYAEPQQLSRELWEHADRPDGIKFLCRHDNALAAIAVYDRAADALEILSTEDLPADRTRLLAWRARYGFDIG